MFFVSVMFTVSMLVLACLTGQSCAACSRVEEETFKNSLGPECQEKFALLNPKNLDVQTDPSLLDSICTSSCLGRYSMWLSQTCNNTNKSWFLRAACLKQVDKRENKRCRLFYPDLVNISTTRQCGVLFRNEQTCGSDCKDPLQDLVTKMGCCFQTIFNNDHVTKGLRQQHFLMEAELIVLQEFQNSNVLSRCIRPNPVACIGDPFPDVDPSSTAGTLAGSLLIVHIAVGVILHFSGFMF